MHTFVTKAARLNGPHDIELIERELVCGEDDIIVKNHLMGICGSDKNFYRGYLPPKTAEFRQDPKFPSCSDTRAAARSLPWAAA